MSETPHNPETGEVLGPPIATGATNHIAAALAKAQASIDNPPRDREVRVSIKNGGSYTFKYATMSGVLDVIRKPLTDNGLWFTQTLDRDDGAGGKYRLRTTLLHASGQSIESWTPLLVDGTGNQAFGSALTYMRRYALCAMLGIAADEDDDGNAGDGHHATAKASPKPPPQATLPEGDGFHVPLPVKIPAGPDGERLWKQWTARFVAGVEACDSIGDLAELQEANKAELQRLAAATAPASAYVKDRIDNRFGILSQAPAEGEV